MIQFSLHCLWLWCCLLCLVVSPVLYAVMFKMTHFDVWWFWSCWSLFFAISLKSSRFGTIWTRGSYSTRRQQLYCVQWRTGSIGTCQRGERGLRWAKVSPACNICDQFNGFICLFLEQMLWRCTRLAERNPKQLGEWWWRVSRQVDYR